MKEPPTNPDIDPESGSRLPLPRRDELDDATRAMFDVLADPEGGSLAGLRGPGGIQLHSPGLCAHSRPLNHYLRNGSGIPARYREVAILTTAREHHCRFEWAAHAGAARKSGVSEATIEAISTRGAIDALDPVEAAIIGLGRELFGTHRVSSETYARLAAHFDRRMLVDLVYTMGSYAMTAAALITFDAQVEEDAAPHWPLDQSA